MLVPGLRKPLSAPMPVCLWHPHSLTLTLAQLAHTCCQRMALHTTARVPASRSRTADVHQQTAAAGSSTSGSCLPPASLTSTSGRAYSMSGWRSHVLRKLVCCSTPLTFALMEYSASWRRGRRAMSGLTGTPQQAMRCSSTRSTPHTSRLVSLGWEG
jgi:hypothetical protein